MYDHREEAHLRLNGSIVLLRGEPFSVAETTAQADGSIRLTGYLGPRRRVTSTNLNDPELTWHNIRLGYMNRVGDSAQYLVRVPARRATQGLCSANVKCQLGDDGRRRDLDWASTTRMQTFADMLANTYPTIHDAINTLDEDTHTIAFSRQFAIKKDFDTGLLFLCYKGAAIGFTETGHDIKIGPKYKHLRDVCIERGLSIR